MAGSLRDVWARIYRTLGDLPADVVVDRQTMLVNMSIRTIADHEGEPVQARPRWVVNLIDASLGLLIAPVSEA